jgi:uncharacterized membrane protein
VAAATADWALFFHLIGAFLFVGGVIVAALALLVVTAAVGAVGGQQPKRARKLATALARDGAEESTELRALLDDRTARALNYLAAALTLAIVALMVFKPGSNGA